MAVAVLVALVAFLLGALVGARRVLPLLLGGAAVIAVVQLAAGSDGETHATYWATVTLVSAASLGVAVAAGSLLRRPPR